ncbi:MAG TPA: MlaD family protein, partial [Methylovirgula sp.]
METRANYALIGLFTLAVIAASFLFVYWVSSPGRSGAQQTYKIIFVGSINGLTKGGWVMFNGVRVGEVKEINLVPQDPQHVYAIVNIDARVPVRADTKAHLESTGFTGVSVVALAGGAADAAPLPKNPDGGPPLIYAQRSDFQDVLESARRLAGQASDLLDKGNKLLDSTSQPLTASAKNIQKFSDALAANSDGIKNFTSAMADVGKSVGPLSTKLSK